MNTSQNTITPLEAVYMLAMVSLTAIALFAHVPLHITAIPVVCTIPVILDIWVRHS